MGRSCLVGGVGSWNLLRDGRSVYIIALIGVGMPRVFPRFSTLAELLASSHRDIELSFLIMNMVSIMSIIVTLTTMSHTFSACVSA